MPKILKRAAMAIGTTMIAGLFATAALAEFNPTPEFNGDPERGKAVYQKVGICVNCHGWAGDGKSGRNPRSPDAGANLRESGLDAQGLYDVIRCGLPGTQMPYHDAASYKDDRCFGMVEADFEPGMAPIRGKTFREKDIVNLVAYMQQHMIGLGKPTYEECADYYGDSAAKNCSYLKSE